MSQEFNPGLLYNYLSHFLLPPRYIVAERWNQIQSQHYSPGTLILGVDVKVASLLLYQMPDLVKSFKYAGSFKYVEG